MTEWLPQRYRDRHELHVSLVTVNDWPLVLTGNPDEHDECTGTDEALWVHGSQGCAFSLIIGEDEGRLRKALAGDVEVQDLGFIPHVAPLVPIEPGESFWLCTSFGSVRVGRETLQTMLEALGKAGYEPIFNRP